MGKKRKSQASRQPIEVLTAQGESHLQAERYREAIDIYKQLLKREERPAWREALANAYQGRAEQLAAKGMYKEAVALWENMAASCGDRGQLARYIDWLLKAGRFLRGARLFAEADEALRQSPDGQRLAALLGGVLVSGHGEIAEVLPADSPLLQQREGILAAMEAYCQGDATGMKEQLKAIPFRSPYRDLRLILQGLAALAVDPQAGVVQLDKLASASPFRRFAQLAKTVALEGNALLEAMTQLTDAERTFVMVLKGWDEQQLKLVGQLPQLQKADVKALFKFAISNGDQFEIARVKGFCLALLPAYPQGVSAFEKQFGALSPFERERIYALVAERRHDLNAARKHWANCVEQLVTARNSGENALKAALILRYMADLQMKRMGPDPWDEAVQDELARSLELDPKDKETYLKLLNMARQRDDRKAQDHWVEKAVRQFPEDAEVLLAAGLSAYRRRAFKKAAGFAQTLLERDPINPHARNLLISCHLAHARKQIKAGKCDLAGRELAAAEQFVREEEQRGIVTLNQGFLALLDGREPESEILLRQGLEHLGSGLVAEFRFMVDGRRLEIAQSNLSKQYNRLQNKPLPPTRKEILALAELLHRYVDDGVKDLFQVLDRLRVPLKAAATLDFTEQELEMVCVAFSKARHYFLLKVYAEAAMKRFGQRPKFFYYYVFGRTKGQEAKTTVLERIQLQGALDRALDAEDHATAAKIEDFLGLPNFGPTGMPPIPPQAAQDLQQIFAELMEKLNTDNPEDVLDFIEERMEAGELPPFPLPLPRGRPR